MCKEGWLGPFQDAHNKTRLRKHKGKKKKFKNLRFDYLKIVYVPPSYMTQAKGRLSNGWWFTEAWWWWKYGAYMVVLMWWDDGSFSKLYDSSKGWDYSCVWVLSRKVGLTLKEGWLEKT